MDLATNLLQWFDVFYPQNDLWEKISWWAKFSKNWLKKKARLAPWMEECAQNLLAQIGSRGVSWIPSTTNVFSWLSGENQSGYGVVRKVLIERFNYIPSMIELAGKTLKTNDKQEAHKQQSMETITCTCEHLGVIKFLAIHTETMEAYTLWWNGGTFLEMLDYNMKYSPIIDNCMLLQQGGPNMEGQT